MIGWSVHYRCTPGTWLVVCEAGCVEGWLFVSAFDAARAVYLLGPPGDPPPRALAAMAVA